jgi:undecaprenyl-diphosphatase
VAVQRVPEVRRATVALALAIAIPLGVAAFSLPERAIAAQHAALWDAEDAAIRASRDAGQLDLRVRELPPYLGEKFVTDDPNDWFNHGSCCRSFPSGEVTLQASFVTPIIVNYAADHPWVWLLEALPAYDAVARVKVQAHWQTDVLAGWALGTAFGYWSAKRDNPLFLEVMPHGVAAGIHVHF